MTNKEVIKIITPINDIVLVNTSGNVLTYTCQIASDKPLKCNAATLRKHIVNELTRMIYSGAVEFNADELSECIERRLNIPQKIEVIGLTAE